jgi:cell division protein FtsL
MKTLVGLAMMGLLLLYVWERVEVVRVGYLIERLKVQKTALQRERDELEVKVSALTSPERIARVAKDQLGMAPPQPGQVVVVRLDTVPRSGGGSGQELRLAQHDARGSVR